MDAESIKRVRAFNRWYTVWLNVMNRAYLGTRYTWQESRILFELYLHKGCSAAELSCLLGMDKSYLSRTLAKLESGGLLFRQTIPGSRGMKRIFLTDEGLRAARFIDWQGDRQMLEKLGCLEKEELDRLCEAMEYIQSILGSGAERQEGAAMNIRIVPAYDRRAELGVLFSEYTKMLVDGDSRFQAYLDLQNYGEELEHLEEKYGEPAGRLYLALSGGEAAGCIALRRLDDTRCEMKRLYVRPAFRGQHLGEFLVRNIIEDARLIGYREMLLDTLPFLQSAIRLYEKLGFSVIEKYNDSPMDSSIYMKLEL